MPALGHTMTEARICHEFERLELADFCRAYLNWWPGEIPADWQVVDEAAWLALADPSSAAVDPVAFAADVTPTARPPPSPSPGSAQTVWVTSKSSITVLVPGGSSAAWSSWPRSGRRAPSWSTRSARRGR